MNVVSVSLLLFPWMVLSVGCMSITPSTITRNQQSSNTEQPLRFLALGDSYTIGEAVDPSERWPVQLADRLRRSGFPLSNPEIVAQTGWTTGELMTAIASAEPQGVFDLVSLLIGVNNQYRGRDIEEYRNEFASLLTQAVRFAGGGSEHVVVLSIPDWGVTPYAKGRDRGTIAREIDLFNSVNREEAQRAGVHYVDVTGVSRKAADDPLLLAPDGLHPSGMMYEQWAMLVLAEMFPG